MFCWNVQSPPSPAWRISYGFRPGCRQPLRSSCSDFLQPVTEEASSLPLERHGLAYSVLWGSLRHGKPGCHLACCKTEHRFGCPIPTCLKQLVKTSFPKWCLESDLENHKVTHTSAVLWSPEGEHVWFSTSCASSWRLQNILSVNLWKEKVYLHSAEVRKDFQCQRNSHGQLKSCPHLALEFCETIQQFRYGSHFAPAAAGLCWHKGCWFVRWLWEGTEQAIAAEVDVTELSLDSAACTI